MTEKLLIEELLDNMNGNPMFNISISLSKNDLKQLLDIKQINIKDTIYESKADEKESNDFVNKKDLTLEEAKETVLNKSNNVPIYIASIAIGKSTEYIRQGLIRGILPIGYAFKNEGASKYSYYISPKKLEEVTGYLYINGQLYNTRNNTIVYGGK